MKHGAGATFRWFKRMALNDLQGNHHAFHDRPVRVCWQDGDCKTLAADVFDILSYQTNAPLLRRLALQYGEDGFFRDQRGRWWFGESALLDWLHRRSQTLDHQTLRLHRWFERELFDPQIGASHRYLPRPGRVQILPFVGHSTTKWMQSKHRLIIASARL